MVICGSYCSFISISCNTLLGPVILFWEGNLSEGMDVLFTIYNTMETHFT